MYSECCDTRDQQRHSRKWNALPRKAYGSGVTAVDTNILVRLLTRDNQRQADRAVSFIDNNAIWVAKTVVLEIAWVLHSIYGFSRPEVLVALRALSGLQSIHLEDSTNVIKAITWAEAGLDFADALHLASSQGSSQEARSFATFDDKLAKRAKRITGIDVATI
jgi:predicted nucleic-acid-binding protein